MRCGFRIFAKAHQKRSESGYKTWIINKKYDIINGRNRILLGNDTIMSSDKEIAHSIAIYIKL